MEPTSAYQAGEAFGRMLFTITIVLAAVVGGVFFIVALIKSFKNPTRGWIIAAVVSGLIALVGAAGSLALAAQGIAKRIQAQITTEAEKKKPVTAKSGGYGLEVPGDWKEMPEVNEAAGIVAGNLPREQYVLVIENLKSDYVGKLAAFDEDSVRLIAEKLTDAVISEREERSVGGYPARHSRITGKTQNLSLVYYSVTVETDRAYYQLLAWTLPSREAAAKPVFQEVFDSFHADAAPSDAGEQPEASVIPAAGNTREMVTAIIGEQLDIPVARIKPGDRFAEDLGADELDRVELVMAIEDEFEITIAEEVAEGVKTVDDFVEIIEGGDGKGE